MGVRLALVTAGAVTLLGLPGPASAQHPCTRIHTVGGLRMSTYCGPARVTLHVGGKTYLIGGGFCYKTSTALAVAAGSTLAGNPIKNLSVRGKVRLPFFTINTFAAPRDGTYTRTEIEYALVGDPISPVGTIVPVVSIKVAGNRTHGSFTGHDGRTISGTFHC